MRAFVSVGLHPTEDKEKVVKAVQNLFPGTSLEGKELLNGPVTDLTTFQELLEKRKIRNTFESLLERNYCVGKTYLLLNKQAAFMGTPNIYAHQELGPIKFELECKEEELHEALWRKRT